MPSGRIFAFAQKLQERVTLPDQTPTPPSCAKWNRHSTRSTARNRPSQPGLRFLRSPVGTPLRRRPGQSLIGTTLQVGLHIRLPPPTKTHRPREVRRRRSNFQPTSWCQNGSSPNSRYRNGRSPSGWCQNGSSRSSSSHETQTLLAQWTLLPQSRISRSRRPRHVHQLTPNLSAGTTLNAIVTITGRRRPAERIYNGKTAPTPLLCVRYEAEYLLGRFTTP